jgi:TatD DNase family protein
MLIDAHLHWERLPHPLQALRRAQGSGVGAVLAVSVDAISARRNLKLCAGWHGRLRVHLGFGLHPEQAPPSAAAFARWAEELQRQRRHFAVIGEVGMPYYSRPSAATVARWAALLREMVDLSNRLRLPLVLHAVHDAAAPALACLSAARRPALFHWLKAPTQVVQAIVEAGHYVSLTPELALKPRDQALARQLPPERILLETDAPWPHRPGCPSRPSDVREAYQALARLRPGVDWPSQILRNWRRFLAGC